MKKDLRVGNPLAFLVTLAVLSGCAGPTTPLGAIWSLTPEASNQKKILVDALKARAFDDTASKTHPETPAPPGATGTAQRVAQLSYVPPAAPAAASVPAPARAIASEKPHPHISFWPKHQNLHSRTPLR